MESIANKIINFNASDFHMHTSSFSDGLNSIEEMVNFAWKIWLKEIILTDHSDWCKEFFNKKWLFSSAWRWSISSYKNMANNVKVSFGVEWDIIDENGNTSFTIQEKESDFCILSAHSDIYKGPPETVTDATIKAIEKNPWKIKFIWHPTCNNQFWEYYDIEKIIETANKYDIALEINCKSIAKWRNNEKKLDTMLKKGNKFYFNSDAHNLSDLQEFRKKAAKFLFEKEYITKKEYGNFINLFNFVK